MADFLEINADLHIHGLFSGATSKNMVPKTISEQAPLKGLQLLGTADILNKKWETLVCEQLRQTSEAIFEHENGTKFILQTEVEDNSRTHHLIYFPSLSKVEEVREKLKKHCKDLDTDGRPKIWLTSIELAEICIGAGCLIGPSHAFVPWTSIFKTYNSVKDCYKEFSEKIHFLELGLSADTNMADRINELHRLTFLSSSDAHSPWPNKLGREFTRLYLQDISFEEIEKTMKREGGRKPILNVKFSPLEGKYNYTRCINCLTFFDLMDAASYKWRCPACHGIIKKGVKDRVIELSDLEEGKHPEHRPKCIHVIPLSEIIAVAINDKRAYSEKVQMVWREFVKKFGNEVSVLLDVPIEELKKINEETAKLIDVFRQDKFRYLPGGGGVYGIPIPPGKIMEMKVWRKGKVERIPVGEEFGKEEQKSITDFF